MEYESNALIVKVDTDDEYEFARDMQVNGFVNLFIYLSLLCYPSFNFFRSFLSL